MKHLSEPEPAPSLKKALQEFRRQLAEAQYRNKIALTDIEYFENKIRFTEDAIEQQDAAQSFVNPSGVQAGEFSRMTLLDALVSYLEKLPERKAKLKLEVIPALVEGGAITSKQRKPLANVKENAKFRIVVNLIRLNGRGAVSYDETTDTAMLTSTRS